MPIPYDKRLHDMYLPATLSSDDYPNLLEPGEAIDTVATSVLLTTFNWPENSDRYARVAKFVNAFFTKINEFSKPPRHPKWKEASISVVVPGWTRFKAAQDWLDNWHAEQAGCRATAQLRRRPSIARQVQGVHGAAGADKAVAGRTGKTPCPISGMESPQQKLTNSGSSERAFPRRNWDVYVCSGC